MSSGRFHRVVAALCAALLLSLSASTAWARSDEWDNPADDATSPAVFDLLILRPLGIVNAGVTTLLFIVPIAPIVLITRPQDIGKPFDKMVVQPVRYVVADPLGQH